MLLRKFSRNGYGLIKKHSCIIRNCILCHEFLGNLSEDNNKEDNEDLEDHLSGNTGGLS